MWGYSLHCRQWQADYLAPGPFDFPKTTIVDFPFLVTPPDFPDLPDFPDFPAPVGFGAAGTGGCQPETSTRGKTEAGTKMGCLGRILRSSASTRCKLLIRISTSLRSSGSREREKQLISSRIQLMLKENPNLQWRLQLTTDSILRQNFLSFQSLIQNLI